MGLFSTRNRSASASRPFQKQPYNANASSAAHSAASLAFLANRPSTPNLSASAAATALRTMSPAPTNVAQVQTKRTLQRQNSNSSLGSLTRGRGQGLQRRDSSGSMTERTFRAPSPHGAGPNGQRKQPPVPQIPANYNNIPPLPVKSHRRTASMEPIQTRVGSPPLTRPAGRGVSLDRSGNQLQPQTKPRVTSLQNISELERTDSNGSQNFSYPNRARPMSPVARSPVSPTANQLTTTPQGQRNPGAAAAAASGAQYEVQRASEQPVKKKKKKVVRGSAEGSHLQQGSMGGPPIVTPLAPGPPPAPRNNTTIEPQVEPKKKKKVATPIAGEGSHLSSARPTSPVYTGRPMSPSYGSDSDSTSEKRERRTQRASGQLQKQPSVVREDWEGEQDENANLTSPARQREAQGLSPMTSPANLQGKKASTAANVSKKIDEASLPLKAENQAVYNAVTVPQSASNKHLAVAENGTSVVRTNSLSPSRSMRFSDRPPTDLTAGKRHEPLPRSVSPAKSALKHSASPTDPLFPGRYIHSQTASEASDNASNISADGVGPYRKKKSARVSFEAEPEIVGTAASNDQSGTPVLLSPQDKISGKKGWFGLGKSKSGPALGTIAAEDELEEVMKPRPALPAFGSVRRAPRDTSEPTTSYHSASTTAPMATPSSASSETSSSSQIPTLDTSTSSDHAIGHLLTQEAARKQVYDSRLPVPPEVTSVEGSGYHSDTESEDGRGVQGQSHTDTHKEAILESPPPPPPTAVSSPPVVAAVPAALEKVPVVTLQPPTPGLEQGRQSDEWLVTVPGGFPTSTEALGSSSNHSPHVPGGFPVSAETSQQELSKQVSSTSPAGLGISEPPPSEIVSAANPNEAPLESLRKQSLEKDDDSDSSAGDSIYSDAAEEASEHGDGFGSINAIVESPVVQTPSNRNVTVPESPLASKSFNQSRPEGSARTASWDQAQNHWSGIAQAYRQGVQPQAAVQVEEHVIPDQPIVQAYADKKPAMKKKKKKTVTSDPVLRESLVPESPPSRTLSQSSPYPRVGPTDVPPPPPFRHSMRATQEPEPQHFRSSMRQRPQSMQQPTARPASPPIQQQQIPPPKKQRGALQKRNIPPGVVPSSAGTMAARAAAMERPQNQPAAPARTTIPHQPVNNDSDSESSFKKRHRRGASAQGSTMRRSMRAPPEPPQAAPVGRGGIRSMSPPVDRRPMSPTFAHKTMRPSMRQSEDTPTMRSQPQQQRSSSLFGRRNRNKSPPARATPMPLTKKITSRFADSDDEDEPRQKTFRSRFEDSSDDEPEPVRYRPVRGIPRKTDDGDSTDLEDSDDEKRTAPKAQPLAINTTQANGAARMTEMPASPTSSTAKKAGFFSRFRSKKDKDLKFNQPVIQEASPQQNISAPEPRGSKLGFSSIEERDRVLEETRLKLEGARAQAMVPSRPALTTNGGEKPERIMSDSWPLPPKIPDDVEQEYRPNTSDGVGLPSQSPVNNRPWIGGRNDSERSAGGTPVYGRTGKKKRFPLLRRAFGLTD